MNAKKAGITLAAAMIVAHIFTGSASAAVVVTLRGPSQQYPNFSALCTPGATCVYGTETFSGLSSVVAVGQTMSLNANFVSNFNTGTNNLGGSYAITGTYSGALTNEAGDLYGGSYNPSTLQLNPYPDASGAAEYSLSIAVTGIPGVNYFGVWITAMDATNKLVLHMSDGSTFSFVSSDLRDYIDQASNGDAYYGNPNPSASNVNGLDPNEPFAYVNFFDTTSYIVQVDFTNTSNSGFESSNHAVGYYDPLNTGTGRLITTSAQSVPEPSSFGMLGCGLLAAAVVRRRRRSRG